MVVREATRHDVITRGLLWCGVAAGPLFLVTALAEGATRADYHPLRHPVSSLALGPHGWMQVANFLVTGALYLSYAVGLWRAPRTVVGTRIGAILIGVAAVGLLGAAAFVTDPVRGYPPGTPSAPGDYTTSGALHDLLSTPMFFGLLPQGSSSELVPKERQPRLGDLLNWLSGDDACLLRSGERSIQPGACPRILRRPPSARRGHDRIRMAHRAGNPHTSRHAERVVAGGADFYPDEGIAPGFIAALSPDGVVGQVADEIAFSNGMATTEDNSNLIIAESLRKLTRLAQPPLRTVGMRSPAAKTHAD